MDAKSSIINAKSSIINKLKEVSPPISAFMHKVPTYLREVRAKAYEPTIVSIGPYYTGKSQYKDMEKVKLRILEYLLERNPEKQIEAYVSRVAALEERARDCYAEAIALNAADFIEMLVLDGCFIIYVVTRDKGDTPFVCRSDLSKVRRDLMLLENQIPFFVLCALYDLIAGSNKVDQLMQCVLNHCGTGSLRAAMLSNRAEAWDVTHILHLIHFKLSPSTSPDDDDVDYYFHFNAIPSAVELRAANVRFKRKLGGRFRTSPFDVEFDKGQMTMPPLSFYDDTESLLRNLIAYEQYLPLDQHSYVTDYAVLLDCLINTSEDVKLLCRRDIIKYWVGDDQAIVDIVNNLAKYITLTDKDMFMHRKVVHRVNIHRKKWWNRAKATLRRHYFNSPWAVVSFLGALLLLILTIAQTILAALQLKNTN